MPSGPGRLTNHSSAFAPIEETTKFASWLTDRCTNSANHMRRVALGMPVQSLSHRHLVGPEPGSHHDCREYVWGRLLGYDQQSPTRVRCRHPDVPIAYATGPWMAMASSSGRGGLAAWSVIRDWVVDWSAFGEIVQVGRFVSVNTCGAPDINRIPMLKAPQNVSFEAATCIGYAAYVPSGKRAWAHLFVLPRLKHLLPLPQHQKQRDTRGAVDGRPTRRGEIWQLYAHVGLRGPVPHGPAGDQRRIRQRNRRRQPPGGAQGSVSTSPSELVRQLLDWYRTSHRELPWRRNADPYRVWVSEVMLQQTPCGGCAALLRAIPPALSDGRVSGESTSPGRVLVNWAGLGYYRRARMLHDAGKAHSPRLCRTMAHRIPHLTQPARGSENTRAACHRKHRVRPAKSGAGWQRAAGAGEVRGRG